MSPPHDYTQDFADIKVPALLIHGRYDRMVAFEVNIAILNHIADSRLVLLNNCGHWPPSRSRPSGPRRSWHSCRTIERDGYRLNSRYCFRVSPYYPGSHDPWRTGM